MDPSCHRLGLLVPIEHHLNATANLSIVADAHPFMSSVSSSEGYHLLKVMHKAQIISNRFLEQCSKFTKLKWPPQSTECNRAPLGCGGTGDSHHRCVADKICCNC